MQIEKTISDIYNDAIKYGISNIETLDLITLDKLYNYAQTKLYQLGSMESNIRVNYPIPNDKTYEYDKIQNLITLIIKAKAKFKPNKI